jgi:hypothetical protein
MKDELEKMENVHNLLAGINTRFTEVIRQGQEKSQSEV